MKLEDFTSITAACFHGEPAVCSAVCPLGVDLRTFMERARQGRWTLAYKLFRNAAVFPSVVCGICHAPCENVCLRTQTGSEAIDVRRIEAACIEFAKNKSPESYRVPAKNERIAIVGAGPAGLSCALNLAQKRYSVTVFERDSGWGGSLSPHPSVDRFREDFDLQFSKLDVVFEYETEIGSLETLAGFDAVYLASGKDGADFGTLRADSLRLADVERVPRGAYHDFGNGISGADTRADFSTCESLVFAGGGLIGRSAIFAIADGAAASRAIETALQTGVAAAISGSAGSDTAASAASRGTALLNYSDTPPFPRVIPSAGESYTKEEAAREAERCMLCDCRKCLDSCEVLAAWSKRPQKIAVEAFLDLKANPPFSSRNLTREAYSCNLCGYCRSVCPAFIDMGEVFLLSRKARKRTGKYPEAFHDFWIRDMDFVTGEAACAVMPDGARSVEYAFFPGCKLGGHSPGRVRSSARFLTEKYGAGVVLNCCGAPAYWAGDEDKQKAHVDALRDIWQGMGRPAFVFACQYCEMLFARFMPELRRISLYELLADAGIADNSLSAGPAGAAAHDVMSVFDPCASAPDSGVREAVRTIAASADIPLRELPERGRCCGFGGHMSAANTALYDAMVENRTHMDDTPYIVYCANCEDVFTRRGKTCVHAIDLALGASPETGGVPADLQTQRDRLLALKSDILKVYTGKDFVPPSAPWEDMEFIISKEILEKMDKALITVNNVKEAVWTAELDGDAFYSPSDGLRGCRLITPVITYWVQYQTEGGAYVVKQVYSHRMHFDEDS